MSKDLEKLNGIDFNNMGETLNFIKVMVGSQRYRLHPSCKEETSELAWDCYVHFLTSKGNSDKNFFERYDQKVTNKMYFVKMGVRNWLVDQERKASRKIKTVSGDCEGESGASIFQFVGNSVADEVVNKIVLEEIIEFLKGEKEWGASVISPEMGEVKLSHHAVIKHFLAGYKPKEIGSIFTISANRVNSIIRESIDLLVNKYNAKEFVEAADLAV